MNRKILYVMTITVTFVLLFGIAGCKKKTDEAVQVKTPAEYKAKAEEEITEDNMEAELNKLEKELEADITAEQ